MDQNKNQGQQTPEQHRQSQPGSGQRQTEGEQQGAQGQPNWNQSQNPNREPAEERGSEQSDR